MNGRDYIANAIILVKNLMEQKVKLFMYGRRAKIPIQMSYRLELGVSQLFNPK